MCFRISPTYSGHGIETINFRWILRDSSVVLMLTTSVVCTNGVVWFILLAIFHRVVQPSNNWNFLSWIVHQTDSIHSIQTPTAQAAPPWKWKKSRTSRLAKCRRFIRYAKGMKLIKWTEGWGYYRILCPKLVTIEFGIVLGTDFLISKITYITWKMTWNDTSTMCSERSSKLLFGEKNRKKIGSPRGPKKELIFSVDASDGKKHILIIRHR